MDELAQRFAELAQQYGPGVVDAAKHAAQVWALSNLASSLIAVGFAVAIFLVGLSFWRKRDTGGGWCDEDVHFAGGFLIALATIPAAIAIWPWIDPWTWTALAHPEVWIAHKILKI